MDKLIFDNIILSFSDRGSPVRSYINLPFIYQKGLLVTFSLNKVELSLPPLIPIIKLPSLYYITERLIYAETPDGHSMKLNTSYFTRGKISDSELRISHNMGQSSSLANIQGNFLSGVKFYLTEVDGSFGSLLTDGGASANYKVNPDRSQITY